MMAFEGTGLAAMRSFSVMVTMHKADGAGLCSLYCRGVVAVRFKCERCVNEFRTEDLLKGHYSACDLEVPKILQDLASGKENKPLTETVSYEKGEEKEKYLSEGKCSAESNTCVENVCGGTGGNSVKERTVDFESDVNPKKCGLSESKKLISAKIGEKASDSSGSGETDTLKSSTNFPRLDEGDSINAVTMQDNAGKSSSKNEQDSCSRQASDHGDEKVEETASSKVIGDLAGKKMGGVISKTGELSSNSSVVISNGSSTPAKESKTTTEEGTAVALDSFVGSRDLKLHSKDLSTSSTDSSAAQGSISGVQEDGSKIGASADGDQSLKDSVSCAIDRVAAGYSMAVPKDRTPRVNPAELMKKIDKSGVNVLGSFQDRNKLYVIVRKKEDTVADPPPKRYVIQNVHEKTKGIPIPSGVELGIQRCSVTTKQGNSDAPLDKSDVSGTNVVSREKRTKRLLGKRRGGSAGTIRRSAIKKKKPEGEMENSEKTSDNSAPKEGDSKRAAPKIVKPKRMRKPWRRSKQMCHLCGRVMSSQTSLKQHLMIHNGVKNFCCALCNKKFTHKQSLKVHQKIHRGERDFACKVCGKTFTRAGDCVQHEKLHEGSEKVVCDQCGKLCKTKKHLMYHMRIHDDDKRYKCEFCGIKFLYHGTYKTHLLNHTGERPYVCATCGKGFKNSSKLRRHNEVHIKREGATYHNYCKVEKEEPSHITYHNYCKVQKK